MGDTLEWHSTWSHCSLWWRRSRQYRVIWIKRTT